MFSFQVHGKWGAWIPYSNCTGACHYGNNTVYRSRVRECDSPAPDLGGDPCVGSKRELIPCDDLPPCERKLIWYFRFFLSTFLFAINVEDNNFFQVDFITEFHFSSFSCETCGQSQICWRDIHKWARWPWFNGLQKFDSKDRKRSKFYFTCLLLYPNSHSHHRLD